MYMLNILNFYFPSRFLKNFALDIYKVQKKTNEGVGVAIFKNYKYRHAWFLNTKKLH